MQGVRVPHVWPGHRDAVTDLRCRRGDEASQGRAVGQERKVRLLRDDLHDQMRAGMTGALLEGVCRGQQAAIRKIDAQPDVDVAVEA